MVSTGEPIEIDFATTILPLLQPLFNVAVNVIAPFPALVTVALVPLPLAVATFELDDAQVIEALQSDGLKVYVVEPVHRIALPVIEYVCCLLETVHVCLINCSAFHYVY